MLITNELFVGHPVFFYEQLTSLAVELLPQSLTETLMTRINDFCNLDELFELNYRNAIFFDHFYFT